jgi:hypothetical protein
LLLVWKLICIDQIAVAGILPGSAKRQITGTNCRLSLLIMLAGDLRVRALPGIGSGAQTAIWADMMIESGAKSSDLKPGATVELECSDQER